MTIFSIADLHLSDGDKPMDVFGANWTRHFERICEDWRARARGGDVVLLPGDLSWAMQLDAAAPHLRLLGDLPGRKVLLKGNHDYWWNAIGRVRRALPPNCYALQNDALLLDGVLYAGSRGWLLPGEGVSAEDERVYAREVLRLEMSLRTARDLKPDAPLVGMMHYPPLTEKHPDTKFTRLFQAYGARHVVYGHLHGAALRHAVGGERGGVCYHQVSCDGLDFQLKEVARFPSPAPAEKSLNVK